MKKLTKVIYTEGPEGIGDFRAVINGDEANPIPIDRLVEMLNLPQKMVPDINLFTDLAMQVVQIVSEKNQKYGDSYGDSVNYLKLLFPNGIPVEKYAIALYLIRDWDKSKRLATGDINDDEDPVNDKLGYALLMKAQKALGRLSNGKGL